jgi:AcrR family transcriptional regulator
MKVGERRRPYRMQARAEAAAATGERILDAAIATFWEEPGEISLNEVASRAGVSVQTVIRRFGTRDALLAAAAEREGERIRRGRDEAPVGDLAGTVRVLVDHYEVYGDRVVRMLSEEGRSPALRELADRGRRLHRDWCARVFAPTLERLSGMDRRRRQAQLATVCDVYAWKILRRDSGLSRLQTELALVELLEPITAPKGES